MPKSLHDMFNIDEDILKYIPNYHLNIINIIAQQQQKRKFNIFHLNNYQNIYIKNVITFII